MDDCNQGFFLFSILWGRWIGDHPQDNLAIFGYWAERKVEKSWNPTIFWQNAGTYDLNLAISKKILFKIWEQLWIIKFLKKEKKSLVYE